MVADAGREAAQAFRSGRAREKRHAAGAHDRPGGAECPAVAGPDGSAFRRRFRTFGGGARAPAEDTLSSPWTGLKRSSPTPQAEPAETPEERAAALAEAEARGLEQGLAQARAEAQAQHEAEREAFAARLAEERARWCEGEAERLAEGFSAALRALDADLTQRIGRLLVPVLSDALRRRALDDLSVALGRLLAEPGQAAIRVSGPEDLLDALRNGSAARPRG